MTIDFQKPTETFTQMSQAASNFEKNILKSPIGLASFFENIGDSTLNAIKSRKILKEAAKLNAVGEKVKADFYRNLAKDFGDKAAIELEESQRVASDLEKEIKTLLSKKGGLERFVKSGQYRTAVDGVLENSIKPSLLDSSLQPAQISYMWRDINKFLDDLELYISQNDGKIFDMPSLKPAIEDLKNVNYQDADWNYCDTSRSEGDPPIEMEPIPIWKERVVKVGRWVMVSVCVLLAIISCNWVAVFELVQQWMVVEEVSREFCGWICA